MSDKVEKKESDEPGTYMPPQVVIESLRNQVDALQVRLDRESKPWYLQFSNWTALLAIVFSVYTLMRENYADVHAKKGEVRAVIGELLNLADEMQRITDPQEQIRAGYLAETKRRHYLEAADLLVRQIPNHISSSEYGILAVENTNDGDFDDAIMYANKSIQAALTDYSRVGAWRYLASVYSIRAKPGDLERMRSAYREAVGLIKDRDEDFYLFTQANTYRNWSIQEFRIGDEKQAQELAVKARDYLRRSTNRADISQHWDSEFADALRFRKPAAGQAIIQGLMDAVTGSTPSDAEADPATFTAPLDANAPLRRE